MSEDFANVRSLTISGSGLIEIRNDGTVVGSIKSYEYYPDDGILFIASSPESWYPKCYMNNDVIDIEVLAGMKLRVNGSFVEVPPAPSHKVIRLVDASIASLVCNGSVSLSIESTHVLDRKTLQINARDAVKVTLPAQSLESLIVFAHEESSVKGENLSHPTLTTVDRLIVRAEARSNVFNFDVKTRLILAAVDYSIVHSLKCSTALRTVTQSEFASVDLETEKD